MPTFTGTSGDDTITVDVVSAGVTTDGASRPGDGNDTVIGGGGADTIGTGRGDDVVTGGQGNDTAVLGIGDDIFNWSPGDGSDTVQGQAGTDTLNFNCANIAENIAIASDGGHTRLTRDVGSVTMDLIGMDTLLVHALGGADNLIVNDISNTQVERVLIDLSASGGTAGDAATDNVSVHGTSADDSIDVESSGSTITVKGLPWLTRVSFVEAADRVSVFGDGGKDSIDASGIALNTSSVSLDGGAGNDTITGSVNIDNIEGGAGADRFRAGNGADILFMGTGADTAFWKSGDGNDTMEGEDGNDRLDLTGSAAADAFAIFANGMRNQITHSVGSATLDVNGIERITIHLGAGADVVDVGSLAGTSVMRVDLDFAEAANQSSADSVTVRGSSSDDTIMLAATANDIAITGLSADIHLSGLGSSDRIDIIGSGGADLIDASQLGADGPSLGIRAGVGNDTVLGSNGDDTFFWAPGDGNDTMNGRGGADLVDISGANVGENINIVASGQQLRFLRDIASITMVTNNIEHMTYHAFGGTDNVTVGDLTGTAATQIRVDLSANGTPGTGDGQTDTVNVAGRSGADDVTFTSGTSGPTIDGLPWQVRISGRDSFDVVKFDAGTGSDRVDLSGLKAGDGCMIDGGLGNDLFIAGKADDIFLFTTALDAAKNVDTIQKFNTTSDFIELDDAIFTSVGATGTLSASAFHVGSGATDSSQRIIYNDANGKLFFDVDGVGGSDAILFARLDAGLALTENNFIVI